MMTFQTWRSQWFGNTRTELLCGLLVAFALIPEAIAFSIIAGVDPKVGLYASFSIATITAFFGGRPAMISAATAATAVLMGTLVRQHGLDYLLAATILAGVLQMIAGALNLGHIMRFVSKSVMTGFVNALAIMIFMAQWPELDPSRVPMVTYLLVALGLAIIYLLPRVFSAIPSPLIAIIVLSAITMGLGLNDVHTVSDMGALPDSLPSFLIPDVPFNFETLRIILPYSVGVAVVGLIESLMTQNVVDERTDTQSDRRQECYGQGVANFFTGFIGGMAGCAMIGQTGINISSGARKRLSTLTAGVALLFFCVVLGEWVGRIPMPALVAVMIMVSIGTFSWASLGQLRTMPMSSNIVMLATVGFVVATHNLAIGVLVGVLLSGIFFAGKIAKMTEITSRYSEEHGLRTYYIKGQIFFATVEEFGRAFDFHEKLDRVVIDLTHAHIWDISSVSALDRAVGKFKLHGTDVKVVGMNSATETLIDRLSNGGEVATDH
ncbi:SulP family inorganic anion transporter [Thioclava sp. BHET1]|nr:SulP family inorganic anion transporter [Thioclava sp. BHET1]